ncbi:MAG: hypothetical protein MPJ50_16845 [Pirellulales bacterium]|nr:hypothetical protein [Pirellulales bacterium]
MFSEHQSAIDSFLIRSAELQQAFFQLQSASGKPRGLRWKTCEFEGDPKFAAEENCGLTAWWSVTISFEAIPGGPMEGVAAVSNLRAASAEFVQNGERGWQPVRVHYNLEPSEAITFARENARRKIEELPRKD